MLSLEGEKTEGAATGNPDAPDRPVLLVQSLGKRTGETRRTRSVPEGSAAAALKHLIP